MPRNNLSDLIGLRNMVSDLVELDNIMSENIMSDIVMGGAGELENTDLIISSCDKLSEKVFD